MTTDLTVRGDRRDPSKASGRCRKAAEHYVKGGCKAMGPSLVWAGFSPHTASDPTRNGYTHDWMIEVARYWNKGSQVTAKAFLSRAIGALGAMVDDPAVAPLARGSAAKTIIDVATKEKDREDTAEVAAEEQAKWMNLIRHWKRTFLRRGILLGRENSPRSERLLAELNWVLGKGPMPEWMETEGDADGEAILGPEGDTRPGPYVEAEIVEDGGTVPAELPGEPEAEPGAGPTDPQ